jgi:alpha-D-ribose 1-methylphosphonate 5-triphosphate diphosphatase
MIKCIINAAVVAETEILPLHAVMIEDDRILCILPMQELKDFDTGNGDMEFYDAHGGYALPGLIDTHSDYIEGVIQPRPTSVMDFEMCLREAEKQLCAQGITTMYHSLSLMQPRLDYEQKSVRTPEHVQKLVHLIRNFHEGMHLIRHRFHARYEIDNVDGYDHLAEMLNKGYVHELSFMDHTPGQGQYKDIGKFISYYSKWKRLASDEGIADYLKECETKPRASHEMLKKLSELAREKNIPIASHDDDTVEKIALVKESYGVRISEFPVNMEVAKEARAQGLQVVMGAPNILLGKSHSGNLSALDAIKEGCVDILCSDYYPSAMLHAVFKLYHENLLTLPQAVALVTANPANALNVGADYGSISPGKKADIVVVRMDGRIPMVSRTFINGRVAAQFQYRKG